VIFVNFFDSFLMSGLRPRNKLRFPHRGRVTFFARAKKVTKETRPRMAPCPTLRGFGSRAAPTRHPVAAGQAQTSLSAPLRALAPSHAVLGCAIRGVENTSTYRSEVGCSNPRRSEPSTEPGRGSSRDSCSSPRRVVCARRVRRAPGRSEGCREPRVVCAAKRPGVFSSGDSSLDKQRRVTQGAGAEPPAISFLSRAKSARPAKA